MIGHRELLVGNEQRVLRPLLDSIVKSPYFLERKLALIKLFMPKIKFQYVDILVSNLQQIVEESD